MRFQIRLGGHGICLVEAETPLSALNAFVGSMGGDPGEAVALGPSSVEWRGSIYSTEPSAVPADPVPA